MTDFKKKYIKYKKKYTQKAGSQSIKHSSDLELTIGKKYIFQRINNSLLHLKHEFEELVYLGSKKIRTIIYKEEKTVSIQTVDKIIDNTSSDEVKDLDDLPTPTSDDVKSKSEDTTKKKVPLIVSKTSLFESQYKTQVQKESVPQVPAVSKKTMEPITVQQEPIVSKQTIPPKITGKDKTVTVQDKTITPEKVITPEKTDATGKKIIKKTEDEKIAAIPEKQIFCLNKENYKKIFCLDKKNFDKKCFENFKKLINSNNLNNLDRKELSYILLGLQFNGRIRDEIYYNVLDNLISWSQKLDNGKISINNRVKKFINNNKKDFENTIGNVIEKISGMSGGTKDSIEYKFIKKHALRRLDGSGEIIFVNEDIILNQICV